MSKLQLVQDPAADALLESSPLALLLGMLLDQQIPMEVAFAGPKKLADRLGGLDAEAIADYDPEKFAAVCAETPAVHRFPGSMVWQQGNPDGREILVRLKRLPGFGDQKARIFLALLGKQYGLTAPGWQTAAGDYGKSGTFMSVADVRDPESLGKVRSHKKQMKAKAKEAKAAKG